MKRERRLFTVSEFRVASDGKRTIRGHAAVFNKDSEPMYGFVERVAPGAFTDSLGVDDVRALFNHDPNIILGRNKAGTLRLEEDDTGLAVEIDPPDTQAARDLLISMERGDITQMSFGFTTIQDTWTYDRASELTLRTLNKVQLFDVSPVTYPAYPDTDVSVRALEEIAAEGKRRIEAGVPIIPGVPLSVRRQQLQVLEQL